MAEALGISAAVVQFVDIGFRLGLKLHSFCSEVRDVPHNLMILEIHVKQQTEVASRIQASILGGSVSLDDNSEALLKTILEDQRQAMETLLDLITSVTNQPGDGILRRGWNDIRAIDKKRKMESVCEQIQAKANLLSSWLANTNLTLSVQIKDIVTNGANQNTCLSKRLDTASAEMRDMLDGITEAVHNSSVDLQAATARVNLEPGELRSRLDGIKRRVSVIDDNASTTKSIAVRMCSETKETLALAHQTNLDVRSLTDEWKNLGTSLALFNALLSSSPELSDTISRAVAHGQSKPPEEPSVRNMCESIRKIHLGPKEDMRLFQNAVSRHECTCRSYRSTIEYKPLHILHFQRVFRRQHFASCPKSKTSEQNLEYIMKFVPPRWLLAHTIHLGLSIKTTAINGNFSIAPVVLGVSRIVDRSKSPAFRLLRDFDQAYRDLRTSYWTANDISICPGPGMVSDMERSLRELFDNGISSPLDEDDTGMTILHTVIDLYNTFGVHNLGRSRLVRPMGDTNAEFLSLIWFLLERGSNPNALCSRPYLLNIGNGMKSGGTVMDIFASELSFPVAKYRSPTSGPLVLDKIVAVGGEFSRPAKSSECFHPHYVCENFESELRELALFPEQFDLCEYNGLVHAILRQCESSMQRALIHCDINHRSPANGLCAIHFAVTWPPALQRLIQAGADLDIQDHLGRRPIQLAVALGIVESVQLLVEADCILATEASHRSLLQQSLTLEELDLKHQISACIVRGLINRHTRLLTYALSILPSSSEIIKLIIPGELQQSLISAILEGIGSQGHECPTVLQLDERGHYQTADCHAAVRLSIPIADQLWAGGFQELEVPYDVQNQGIALTPILEAWFNADFEILRWLLAKGASMFSKHPSTGGSGLHLYAHRLQYPGTYFETEISSVPYDKPSLTELSSDDSAWRDSCSCICSTRGCRPVTVFLKMLQHGLDFSYFSIRGFDAALSKLRHFWERISPPPGQELTQVETVLRFFAFDQSNARHLASCCYLGQHGENVRHSWRRTRWRKTDISADDPTLLYDSQMVEERFQSLQDKMKHCGCPLLDKPACVVYRNICPLGDGSRETHREVL